MSEVIIPMDDERADCIVVVAHDKLDRGAFRLPLVTLDGQVTPYLLV